MTRDAARLSPAERVLLILPLLGGGLFGLGPLLIPAAFARIAGYAGDDLYIARLAGAATFGYVVALVPAVMQEAWTPVRIVTAAILVFNLASLYACVTEIARGTAGPVVYLILVTSILLVAITAWMLRRHTEVPRPAADVAPWVLQVVGLATVLAAIFGLGPLLLPQTLGRGFGFAATDVFLYRQSGAATLGYAAMGILQLRSRAWPELRLPALMALGFNGLAAIVSIAALAGGERRLLVVLVGAAATVVALLTLRVLLRGGK